MRRKNRSSVFVCVQMLAFLFLRGELGAQTSTSQRTPRVLVSAREVRVIFPKDTARTWGWPTRRTRDLETRYSWGMLVESIEGNRWLYLGVGPTDSTARRFASLSQLVAAGRTSVCKPGMFLTCDVPASAVVIQGQVHLVLRDSSTIRKLFGSRPKSVATFAERPKRGGTRAFDSVRVEYVAPQIPSPDSAFRAEAALALRRAQASSRWRSRKLISYGSGWNHAWMAVGDSMRLEFEDLDCVNDTCTWDFDDAILTDVKIAAWSLSDSAVATLRVRPDSSDAVVIYPRRQIVFLRGENPGRTVVYARPLRELPDSSRYGEQPPKVVEREVIVTRPIARVELSPRPDSVVVGDTVTFAVRVIDREGNVVERAPVELSIVEDHWNTGIEQGRTPLVFRTAGRRTVVARLGSHSDSLSIIVRKAVR